VKLSRFNILLSLVIFSAVSSAAVPDPDIQGAVEKLFQSVVEGTEPGKSLLPHQWTATLVSESLEMNGLIHREFPSGIAYGSTSAKRIEAEPDGTGTRLFVLGVHIIKKESRVPWIGRATATSFAKTHYSNFILALESMLKKPE
jgi:hypothetical protein